MPIAICLLRPNDWCRPWGDIDWHFTRGRLRPAAWRQHCSPPYCITPRFH